MKSHYIIGIIAVVAISSCNDKINEMLVVQDEQKMLQESVFVYDMYFDSEITSYDGTTRAAMVSDWEDGDVVFLYFGGNNDTYGKAEYISNSKKWQVTCGKALVDDTNASCDAWCCKGVNPYEEAVYVSYKCMTEAYTASNGSYTYSNNSIYINVTMHPLGWRLRFKGEVGTKIEVQETTGFSLYKVILKNTARAFGLRSESFFLTVGSNGYTDYFVGCAESGSTNLSISNENTGEIFSRYFDSKTLKEGESYCFTIPTSSDLHGWNANENGHAYVDLGLPSGTLWATCNVGATKPEEYGGYYAWGETEEKQYYYWSTYTHCNGTESTCHIIGDDIAGTQYDVAHMKWGGAWRMPSKYQIEELVNYCTTTWTSQNGVNGTLFTGPNGASIFLPAAGNRWNDYLDLEGMLGDYWSSSIYPGYNQRYAYNLYCGLESDGVWRWGWRYGRRCSGFTVRPVIP